MSALASVASLDALPATGAALVATVEEVLGALGRLLAAGLLHGTVLFTLALLLSVALGRRVAPAFLAAVFTVVLVKFVVPVGPGVPVSVSALLGALWSSTGPVDPVATAAGAGPAAPQVSAGQLAWLAAELVLLAGYVVLVTRRLRGHLRAHRRHRAWAENLQHGDQRIVAAAERAARAVGLGRPVDLRVTSELAAPELVGVIRPIVVVPARLADDPRLLEAVLVHELAHVRRKDAWLRVVQLVIGSLFFFWPVVHWINRRIDGYREMACDQWVIARGSVPAGEYARTLVAMARDSRALAPLRPGLGASLGVALGLGHRQLEARVACVLDRRARPRMSVVSASGLALWALVSLGGAGPAQADFPVGAECVIEPGVVESILAAHPEADIDGDGALSRDEVCAYQRRRRIARPDAADGAPVSVASTASIDEPPASMTDEPAGATSEAPEMEWLDCAVCGECNDASASSADAVADKKKICSID